MNDYDSNRIVDLLGEAMQLEKTEDLNEADVVVLNTCSIREKAQEKVFSDLGRIREAKRDRPDMMIAVGGCVASQEGAGIVKRAPWVDVVFGPQTMHRLPEMLGERARTGKPQKVLRLLYPSWRGAQSTARTVWCLIPAVKKSLVRSLMFW